MTGADATKPSFRCNKTVSFRLLLLLLLLCCCWLAAYLGVKGRQLVDLSYPRDGQGRICGTEAMSARPVLLIFDLSKCVDPKVSLDDCDTPQICVTSCPQENFSPLHLIQERGSEAEIKEKMRPFCADTSQQLFANRTIQQLIASQNCPQWYLKSSPMFGRCFPVSFGVDYSSSLAMWSSSLLPSSHSAPAFGSVSPTPGLSSAYLPPTVQTGLSIGIALLVVAVLVLCCVGVHHFAAGCLSEEEKQLLIESGKRRFLFWTRLTAPPTLQPSTVSSQPCNLSTIRCT